MLPVDDLVAQYVENLERDNSALREALKTCLPIVEAAYWDHHTAGTLPGSGYNHKAEHMAGNIWGWWKSDKFKLWAQETKKLLDLGGDDVRSGGSRTAESRARAKEETSTRENTTGEQQ